MMDKKLFIRLSSIAPLVQGQAMNITDLVRAKRQCATYAWVGWIIASFLIIVALAIPMMFLLVAALLVASYSTAKGSRLGAGLHTVLIGVLLAKLVLGQPSAAFSSVYRWLTILLLIGFTLSLFGLKAAFTYRNLLPKKFSNKESPSVAEWLSHKLTFLHSGKIRATAFYSLLALVSLLPVIVPTIVLNIIGFDNIGRYLPKSEVMFWVLMGGYSCLAPLFAFGVWYFFTKAKRTAALRLEQARERDHRRPVLLLRSFQDDLTPVARKLPFTSFQSSDFYSRAWTLEESIEKTLWAYGPVIAIGRPGEKMPPAGAAREYVSNDEWQDRVKDYISDAQLVAVIVGKTAGLDWEYQQLTLMKAWTKLVLLFPPVAETELRTRWTHFQKATGLGPCHREPNEVSNALLATFSEEGSPRFVTCKWRNDEECYRLALRCGLAASP